MTRLLRLYGVAAVLMVTVNATGVLGKDHTVTLAVTMTNDAESNEIKVYDATTNTLVQTLSTHGKGGVGGNARGVRQLKGDLVAAVNNGSNSVALFTRNGNGLRFDRLVATTSAPVSIDFGNDHMVRGGGHDGRFVRDAPEQRGLDGWLGSARAGERRRAAERQHGAGWRGQRSHACWSRSRPIRIQAPSISWRFRDGAVAGGAPVAGVRACGHAHAVRILRLSEMERPSSRWRIQVRTDYFATAPSRRSSPPARLRPAGPRGPASTCSPQTRAARRSAG